MKLGLTREINDTLIFHAWLEGLIDAPPAQPFYHQTEELNQSYRDFDIARVSMPTLASLAAGYTLLPVGVTMVYEGGPYFVYRNKYNWHSLATPGVGTTGHLVTTALVQTFSDIRCFPSDQVLGQVEKGNVDCGIVIHSGAVPTSLNAISLPKLWFDTYQEPLPLGGLVAREYSRAQVVSASLSWGWRHRDKLLLEPELRLKALVWVTKETFALSSAGQNAISRLVALASA